MITVGQALLDLRQSFRKAGLESPETDAYILLQEVTGLSREHLFIHNQYTLTFDQQERISQFKQRRLNHEPVARIIGRRAFWTGEFKVTADTLDPRPDSEILIESALRYCTDDRALHALDLGTGSGCLLLSFLSSRTNTRGLGLDIQPAAVKVAQENAERLGLAERVDFQIGDWNHFIFKEKFDVLFSNPPYISALEMKDLAPEVRNYDPPLALLGGEDGLDCYRSLAMLFPQILAPGGLIFLEIGWTQSQAVCELIEKAGTIVLEIVPDLAGHDRCIVAKTL